MFLYKQYKCLDKKGFTLAEVLLTLIVIGVIAALTVPALLQNIHDAQLKTAWKGAYSIINQATSRILAENGGSFLNYFYDEIDMRNQFANYISTLRKCDIGQAYGNCFASVGQIKYYNGDVLNTTQVDNDLALSSPGLITSNGFSIVLMSWPECSALSDGRRYCGWLAVDVNGPKSPNTIGKDIFRIWILDTKAVPQGTQGYYGESDCDTYGWKCAAMYLQQ